uniref:Nuclear pore complex protein Nup153 n=1 Tax=Mola mola TaxID=94237 RepID=A0A3Q3X2J2_MOLML
MAATGGGKIRSRRYHIASKPYAKSKQQSGLISRVTDTVKSIVPSWLQKYFKNGDVPEGGGVVLGTEQNCQLPTPPPNGSKEGPPPLDGRDSPEPSTSNTEPTTSRASLNFQEYVLSRPPLSRSHLHFPPPDASSPNLGTSSSLFSQPSTSSAPGPFSTGFSLVKEIKDNLSQHEDDNISTTSGFSSRASDKDVPTSKTASLPQLWSPETDRTNTGPQPSQSSLKKPTFNLSVFGTSSSSTFNNTMLNSSHLGDSPFYPGKTTYGGAAAVRSARNRPGTPYQAPMRRQIKAKPAGAQPCGVTSATARRILQSLERMSSPLADARRIPASASSPLSAVRTISLFLCIIKTCFLPPVQKLVVPAAAPLPGNRSVSFRPTLTPGGLNRPLDKTPIHTPTRQSPQPPEAVPGPSQSVPAYPLFSTPAASSVSSGGGKMKREKSTARVSSKRLEEEEVTEVVDLPTLSLPISTSSLPTFSFTSPLPPITTPSTTPSVRPVAPEPQTASSPPCVPFTFSSPIVKATAASPPSFSPSAGFTFSAPVAKLGPSMSTFSAPVPVASKSTEDFEGPFKPAKTLKMGSVLDLLKAPGSDDTPQKTTAPSSSATTTTSSLTSSTGFGDLFKPPPGWSCDVCLVQNKSSDTKCVCCMAPQPNSSSSTSTDNFGTLFSKPVGTWECDTCLVINKPDAVKCVACETAKPGTGLKPSLTIPSAFSAVKTTSTPTAPVSTGFIGFGDKFKKAEGAWECDSCMVENKAEDTKCVACTSAKPAAKPGATEEPKAVGTSGSSTSSSGGFKFGTSDSSAGSGSASGFKFGGSLSESSSSSGFKFGGSSEGFKFGTASSDDNKSEEPAAVSGFKFGASSGVVFGTGSSNSESNASKSGFSFGLSKAEDKMSTTTTTTSSVRGPTFGSLQANKEPAAPTFTFAKPEEKKDAAPSPAPSAFLFGAASKDVDTAPVPATSGGFSFGKPSVPTEQPPPMFSFGKSAEKCETTTAEAPKPSFTFGQNATDSSAAPKPAFSFMDSNPTSSNTTSSSSITTPSLFGTSSSSSTQAPAPPAAPSTFIFGQPVTTSSDAPPAKAAFVFGQSQDNQPCAPSTASLNSAPPPAPAPTQPFIFGASASAAAPAAAAAPSFGFGAAAPSLSLSPTAPSAASSPFTFSSAPSGGFGANQTPSFGSSFGSPFTATPSQTLAFGANSTATPVFGQQANSTPAFGATTNSAPGSGGFQFGGASAFGATNNTSGVFTFGAGAAASPAPSANPSITPQSGAAGGGFNFAHPPTFSIGSAKSFSPSPAGQQPITGRKIKTAVRRRK